MYSGWLSVSAGMYSTAVLNVASELAVQGVSCGIESDMAVFQTDMTVVCLSSLALSL